MVPSDDLDASGYAGECPPFSIPSSPRLQPILSSGCTGKLQVYSWTGCFAPEQLRL